MPAAEWRIEDGVITAPAVRDRLRAEVDRLLARDRGFRPIERVARFVALAEPMSPENGMLTQTLKTKRHVVHDRYADAIAGMSGR